jgi:siroheme synthase
MREDRPLPLTSVDPSQIWLIEHDPSAALCALDRAVLTRANVVLYDRALAALVAQALPIGAYAEPLPATSAAAGPAIAPRALDFAGEGWSVVQLVAAGPAWRARLPILPPALLRAHRSGALPVRVIVKTAGDRHHEWDASLDEFAELVRETGNDEPLTLVFGPFASRHPAQPHAFTANGLAG